MRGLFCKTAKLSTTAWDRSGCHRARENVRKVRRAEVEDAGNQARMIARDTWSVRMEMTILRKTPKRCEL